MFESLLFQLPAQNPGDFHDFELAFDIGLGGVAPWTRSVGWGRCDGFAHHRIGGVFFAGLYGDFLQGHHPGLQDQIGAFDNRS